VILPVLRLEIPSDMCAELRTMAASNNRVHALQSFLLYWKFDKDSNGL